MFVSALTLAFTSGAAANAPPLPPSFSSKEEGGGGGGGGGRGGGGGGVHPGCAGFVAHEDFSPPDVSEVYVRRGPTRRRVDRYVSE